MRERGGAVGNLLAAIGLVVVVMAIIFSVCMSTTGASQPHSLAPAVTRHDDCDSDWDGDCGDGSGYNEGGYGQGRNSGGGGGNGNRGRKGDHQRSGRDSCHSFCGNTIVIPMPGETTTTTRGDQGE